jgi:hypothetical protein
MSPAHQIYQTKSAVLFIIFNRTDTTLQVLAKIREAKPSRLYLTADGPRTTKAGEDLKCAEAKAAVLAGIDWDCEIKTLFRKINVGPKVAISSAIDWFFEQETEGIILEHDCLPANSFFMFCDTLLEKYRFDTRVWLISGSNLVRGKKWGEATYYFSQLTNGWGFATWKRSWKDYDVNLTNYTEEEVEQELKKAFDDPLIIYCWLQIFKDTKSGKIDTWDYQAGFAHLFGNCVNIVPNNNLVSNIGFGEGAENTVNENSMFAGIPLEEISEVTHPKFMLPEKEADRLVLLHEFGPTIEYLKKHNSARRRFKRWLRSLFK